MKKINIHEKYERIYKKSIYISIISALLLINACDKQIENDDGYVHEESKINAEEHSEQHFFKVDNYFNFSGSTVIKISELLRIAKASGIDNIEYLIVSDVPVPVAEQEKISNQVKSLMYEKGFIRSRIMNKGVCVYKGAEKGVRIGLLTYVITEPDCNLWSEYIGDTDTHKVLPRYKAAQIYNWEEMIANPADFVTPREYPGVKTETAISAVGTSGGGGSSASSSSSSSS